MSRRKLLRAVVVGLLLIAILLVVGITGYRLLAPEIVVRNEAPDRSIIEVVVRLPSSRVVFGEVAPGSEAVIYYSGSQDQGDYVYEVALADGRRESGSCSLLAGGRYGRRLTIRVDAATSGCREEDKLPL